MRLALCLAIVPAAYVASVAAKLAICFVGRRMARLSPVITWAEIDDIRRQFEVVSLAPTFPRLRVAT